MKILALEFSSPERSVAVLADASPSEQSAGGRIQSRRMGEAVETGARSSNALGMVEAALREAWLEREQIECIAVGLGPGSYVGVRSAIALAQGWELAGGGSGLRVIGISSAECLAAQAHAGGIVGRVGVVIDAQRQEFYLEVYDLAAEGWRGIEPLRLATLAEVQAFQKDGGLIIGPEVANGFEGGRVIFPRAASLAELAQTKMDSVAAEELKPIYLREIKFVKAIPPRILPD